MPLHRPHRALLPSALLIALASQLSVNVFAQRFNVSVAIVLLPVLLFRTPDLPVFLTALLAAPGVFFLRCAVQWLTAGTFSGCWAAYAPEILFYLCYGLFFRLYTRARPFQPLRFSTYPALVAIDLGANCVELLARDLFYLPLLLQLLLLAVLRAALVWLLIRTLENYGFQVLRGEDVERYHRLLLMTATLKSEVVWMEKGTALLENTMSEAYRLYSRLRQREPEGADAGTALAIAKDIHEVKKEYLLLMRGISEALELDAATPGMELDELFAVLSRSVQRTARAAGKEVLFHLELEEHFYTTRHHYLMSIFRNLFLNAVEAAGPGQTAHIAVTQRREGDAFLFTVSDDCGGIPPARMSSIFTPGFSTKINYATGEISRGLGLPIVKDLVEQELGGAVSVTSQGGGTEFTLRIPISKLEEV